MLYPLVLQRTLYFMLHDTSLTPHKGYTSIVQSSDIQMHVLSSHARTYVHNTLRS